MVDVQSIEALESLFAAVKKLTDGAAGESRVTTVAGAQYPILVMYSRSRSLFEGVRVLVREGLCEEAFVLARSLFEESLRLLELASAFEARREGLCIGWIVDAAKRKRTLANIRIDGDDERAKQWANMTAEEQAQLELKARNTGIKPESFPRLRTLCKVHDRTDEYLSYVIGSHMTHGNLTSMLMRMKRARGNEEQFVQLHLKSDAPVLRGMVLAFSLTAMLDSHEAVAGIYQWKDGEQVGLLRSRLSAIVSGEPEP